MRRVCIAVALLLSVNLGLSAGIKVACVGDSITVGVGTENRETESYPAQLQKMLGSKYEVMNLGASSRTLMRGAHAVPWANPKRIKLLKEFKPDIITLMLGTNDSKERHWRGKDSFENDVKWFIDEFKSVNPKAKVYICLPLPAYDRQTWTLSPPNEKISGEIIRDGVIPKLKKVAAAKKIEVIDTNSAFMKLEPEKVFKDGVHPTAAGATVIAEMLAERLTSQ